ncbi:TadE/TadG family type IV pilus assembly protein [Methylopila sp. M107]|uniref:TadE/TadG family type IV pilus assembly protein n=1 Tax=Methylopila sp. M107 TaxID=1101190 RepID=UPI00037CB7A0|nr:TadE/TadG family type IV pilus assembly protein [Methylopila sp. M107]
MRRHLIPLIDRLRRSTDGLAAIEFALFAPVLGLLMLGGYDLSRFIIARANVDRVGFSVADVTSQYDQLSSDAMTQVFKITGSSLPNYVSGTNGVTILTSIYLDSAGSPRVKWQCYSSSGSTWKSAIGVEGGVAAINAKLLADTKDNVMTSEVYFVFKPIFTRFFKSDVPLYTTSIYRPRLGALTTKPC